MTVTDWSPTDSVYQAQLRRAHEELRASTVPDEAPWQVRAPVLDSWRRSLAALPAGTGTADAVLEGDELARARRAHPFSAMLPLLRSRLIEPAVDAGLVVALGDAEGRLLWVEGRSSVTSRADAMGFAAGADWSEGAMGTSAPALALTTGSGIQVVGAEHFQEAVHPWSCSAVPVLDPRTGRTVGVLDVTGSADAVAPLVLPLLAATSRAWAEAFQAHHARAVVDGLPIPAGAGERAAEIIDDLADDASRTLTHGDLSFENVMCRGDGSWVAIDPALLSGPVETEAHTVVRSVLASVLEEPRPREALRGVVEAFCEAAGADADRAAEISFARAVASWFWEAQHNGRTDDIERLRRLIELTVK